MRRVLNGDGAGRASEPACGARSPGRGSEPGAWRAADRVSVRAKLRSQAPEARPAAAGRDPRGIGHLVGAVGRCAARRRDRGGSSRQTTDSRDQRGQPAGRWGAGKTPLVARIAHRGGGARTQSLHSLPGLRRRVGSPQAGLIVPGERAPAAEVCGDEAALLHDLAGDAVIGVGADRIKQFERARSSRGGLPDLVVLDDGFQHWRIHGISRSWPSRPIGPVTSFSGRAGRTQACGPDRVDQG